VIPSTVLLSTLVKKDELSLHIPSKADIILTSYTSIGKLKSYMGTLLPRLASGNSTVRAKSQDKEV
jgi:hypothetical protein